MSNPKNAAADSRRKTGPLIYVVDDEPMLLELATLVLEPLGYQLQTFRDPEEAMQAFIAADPRPAIVITDYAMHRLNGMDLIKRCKQIQPKQKIILVSGTVGHEVFQDAPVRPDRFLAKPYEARQLSELVEAVLTEHA